jgi:hypothetical protein
VHGYLLRFAAGFEAFAAGVFFLAGVFAARAFCFAVAIVAILLLTVEFVASATVEIGDVVRVVRNGAAISTHNHLRFADRQAQK